MTRAEVLHVLRAAVAITGHREWVAVGSQALALWFVARPPILARSQEIDLYAPGQDAFTELAEGSLGEGSLFQDTFGYYAHGVGEDTAVFPSAWPTRAQRFAIEPYSDAVVVVPSPADLAVAKLLAFRDKDLDFVETMLSEGMVTATELARGLGDLDRSVPDALVRQAMGWVRAR
jgi:hypothetical protein